MGKPVPKEVTKAIRAIVQLDAAIEELQAAGIRMKVTQRTKWANQSYWVPDGFDIEMQGRFAATNIKVPEKPKPLAVKKSA